MPNLDSKYLIRLVTENKAVEAEKLRGVRNKCPRAPRLGCHSHLIRPYHRVLLLVLKPRLFSISPPTDVLIQTPTLTAHIMLRHTTHKPLLNHQDSPFPVRPQMERIKLKGPLFI